MLMEINQIHNQKNVIPDFLKKKFQLAERMDFLEGASLRRSKKTRRGKKKNRNLRDTHEVSEIKGNLENCLSCERLSPYDGDSEGMSPVKKYRQRQAKGNRRRQTILRPRYSPKAPHNSTQFLMDDHFTYSCEFLGFESPDPWGQRLHYSDDSDASIVEPPEPADDSLLFQMDDLNDSINSADQDTKAFMEKDFEDAYNSIQIDEASRLSKSELISAICSMESKAELLEKELECSPTSVQFTEVKTRRQRKKGVINQLKRENLNLQRENDQLKRMLLAVSCS
ncbi:protein HEXIM1-like [Saccostrea cucullata]|uniref:protein HEXIM1-like n=1 Tax=Saccostrea cuccullata TaxID=36930 RepID=UPI002ED6249F